MLIRLVEVDESRVGSGGCGGYLRARVDINVNDPLIKGVWMKSI